VKLSIGAKVGACVLALGILFTLGGVVVLDSIRRLTESSNEIKQRDMAVQYSLTLASCARDQYIHEAHLIITQDTEHVTHFDEVVERMKHCQEHVRIAAGDELELGLVDTIDASISDFRKLFYSGILPAVKDQNHERALRLHHESDELLTKIVKLNQLLSDRFKRKNEAAQDAITNYSRRALLVTVSYLVLGLALAFGSFVFIRRALSPIRELKRATEQVAEGRFDTRVKVVGQDELAELARDFNQMAERLQSHEREILQAERAAALGQLAAGVAHQINNPLAVILGYTNAAEQPAYESQMNLKQVLKVIGEEARECHEIVNGLLAMTRPIAIEPEAIEIKGLVTDIFSHALRYTRASGVELVLDVSPETLSIRTDKNRIRQILMNLTTNAIECMPKGGIVQVRVELIDNHQGQCLQMKVVDQGPGLDASQRAELFKPFRSTKPRGIGLGLSLALGVARSMQGDIQVESTPGKGSTFIVLIPIRS